MSQNELDPFPGTNISQPVPGEGALHTDNQALAEGGDCLEKGFLRGRQILVIDDFPCRLENADIHPAGVQIYPAIVLTGLNVESHWRPPGYEVFDTPEPTP